MPDIHVKGQVVRDSDKWIYDWYGMSAICPKDVQKVISNANGQPINIRINSGGGDVFAGCEIYNALREYRGDVNTIIEGLAGSIASVIAMAGKCKMSTLAEIMIHNVSTDASGDYRDMEHTAEVLKKTNKLIANSYMIKTGMSEKEVFAMMDKETWLTADEAKEMGFVDEILHQESPTDKNITNILKNNVGVMYNSLPAIPKDVLKRLRQVNIMPESQPRNEVDFFIQQKAKAQLNLLKLGGKFNG